jgi:hypothetical protein
MPNLVGREPSLTVGLLPRGSLDLPIESLTRTNISLSSEDLSQMMIQMIDVVSNQILKRGR